MEVRSVTIEEARVKQLELRQAYGLAMAFKPADVVEKAAERLDEADNEVVLAVLDEAVAAVCPDGEHEERRIAALRIRIQKLQEER